MGPIIVMPDSELWASEWTRAALADPSVYVGNAVPNPRRSKMVIFRDDGGPRVDFLHRTLVMAVNVYAPTEKEVSDLANLVEALLVSVRASYPVEYVTSLAAPVRADDAMPRRFMTLEITMLGYTSGQTVPPFVYPAPGGGDGDLTYVDNGDGTFTLIEET